MKIDSELEAGLAAMLKEIPGGFNAPETLAERRILMNTFLSLNPVNEHVTREDFFIPGIESAPNVKIRLYRPISKESLCDGALMVIHGGGMVMGNIDVDDANASFLCESLNVVTISVEYRLAPEHPFPAAIEDCHAAAGWLFSSAQELGINSTKIAVFGGSAGGGLAIGLALLLRDRNEANFALVMAPYPMIDDRNTTASSHEITNLGVWDRLANIESWNWYLGDAMSDSDISPYAAPSRAKNLSNLPPIFIDVGTCDLFRDENIEFAERLAEQGACEFHLYEGAFHASELIVPEAQISQTTWNSRISALRGAIK